MTWPDHQFLATPITAPFTAEHINPASADVTLSPRYLDMGWSAWHSLMPRRLALALSHQRERVMPPEGVLLWPGQFFLASTVERITIPEDCAALLTLKSTPARLGLSHPLSAWFDPAFEGDGTMEFTANYPALLTPHMRIMQLIVFPLTSPPLRPYSVTGRYQEQSGPTIARSERP